MFELMKELAIHAGYEAMIVSGILENGMLDSASIGSTPDNDLLACQLDDKISNLLGYEDAEDNNQFAYEDDTFYWGTVNVRPFFEGV